jgi:hypothetical protein
MTLLASGEAAELTISIDNPPINGTVIAMLFNSRSTFVDLRDPVRVITLPSGGTSPGRIPDLASGEYTQCQNKIEIKQRLQPGRSSDQKPPLFSQTVRAL